MYVASTVHDHQKVAVHLRKHIEPLLKVTSLAFFLIIRGSVALATYDCPPLMAQFIPRFTKLTWQCGPTITPTRRHVTSFVDNAGLPTGHQYTLLWGSEVKRYPMN